jgi:hypothetical protein
LNSLREEHLVTETTLNALETVSIDRRAGKERRKENIPGAVTFERRKSPRRRQIDPTTCERDYSPDEVEFMQAMDAYKQSSGRMFPTCSEVLEVVKSLGYAKLPPAAPAPAAILPTVETIIPVSV